MNKLGPPGFAPLYRSGLHAAGTHRADAHGRPAPTSARDPPRPPWWRIKLRALGYWLLQGRP